MKKLLLILALLVASVGAHAQGTWSGLQTTTVAGMTHGYMNWHYLLLNYTGSGVRSPVLVYLHQNDAGNPCYPTSASGCSTLIQSASSGGTGVTNWFNNSTFQSQYCASGCIVVSPYADQTSDTSGVTSNFGGYNDSPGSMANERGVIAVLQYVLANFNADPSRVYVTGDGMGGAGAMALGLDYGVGTGSLSPQIITATLPFSGAIYRNGATAPTSAQVSQIEGGGIQFSVSGGGDVTTGQAPSQWVEPLWDAIAGKPSGNNMGLSVPTPAAAVGYNTLTFGPSITVSNVSNSCSSYPNIGPPYTGATANNWAPYTFGGTSWASIGYTVNSDGSVSLDGSGEGYGNGLSTAVSGNRNCGTGQQVTNFTGQTFGGGEFVMFIAKSNGPFASWANDIETQNSLQVGLPAYQWPGQPSGFAHWVEDDIAEFDSTASYGFAIHDYSGYCCGSGTTTVSTNYSKANWAGGVVPDFTQYRSYAMLYVPATSTTLGYMKYMYNPNDCTNGCAANTWVTMTNATWSQYQPTVNGPPPVDPTGFNYNQNIVEPNTQTGGGAGGTAFAVNDALHLYFIIGGSCGGCGQTATWKSVQVWQANGQNDLPVVNASNGSYPGPPVGGRAASSPFYLLVDPGLSYDTWDTYRVFPAATPILNILFAAQYGTTPAPNSPGALPSGYLTTSGNQIQSGTSNVRLSCSGYFNPTSSPSNDMSIMRVQGFNCARVPWYDATLCPGGTCSFANADAIVTAATNNGMKVIFDHQSNEGINGSGSCTVQQANGLWYDQNASAAPWNGTNNTDGCGTAGTTTYAQFKANTVALATHYKGNSTVIGFDLANEPTTYGNAACCNTGGTTGTGNFSIKNGKIYDPNGNLYVPVGINIDDNELAYASTNNACQPLTQLYPGINHVRLRTNQISNEGTGSATYPPVSTYTAFVNQCTANKIVVEIEDHSCNGSVWEPSSAYGGLQGQNCAPPQQGSAALVPMTNFYTALAQAFGTNPYVWFGTLNEPSSSDGTYNPSSVAAISNYEQAFYNAIRVAGGSNNVIQMGMGVGDGDAGTVGTNGGMTPSVYTPMTNIVWELHAYYTNGEAATCAGYTTAAQYLAGGTNGQCGGNGGSGYIGAQTMTSADGTVPVIFGEWGSGTGNATNGDASQIEAAMIAVAQSNSIGSTSWAWYPSTQWQQVNNGFTGGLSVCNPVNTISNSCYGLTTWGTQAASVVAQVAPLSGTGGGGTSTIVGASWGTGAGGDVLAMANDVGAAVVTANPGALIIVEGPYNNGTLFNGITRGSATLPITAGPIADLSLVASKPVTCCTGKVVYSIHDMPNSVSGVSPDSGAGANLDRKTAWGYLVNNNTAPVWIGKMGASLDNTNGAQGDEGGWASTLAQFVNGQASAQGGPSFSCPAQPMGADWWTYGYLPGQSPDGTLTSTGANNTYQSVYWSTLLYTSCSTPPPAPTVVWNPNDLSGVTLSNSNLTATAPNTSSPGGSTNNTQVPPSTSITDASGNIFTVSGGVVVINGTADGTTRNVILLAYENGVVYQENTAGNWYGYGGSPGTWPQYSGSPLPAPVGVRTSVGYLSGKYCADVSFTVSSTNGASQFSTAFSADFGGGATLGTNWVSGIADSSFSLSGTVLGTDTNAIAIQPNRTGNAQAILYNGAILASGAMTSNNGDVVTQCADFTNHLYWVSDTAMRATSGVTWNNSTTANPTTGVGGISFSGVNCPCYIAFGESGAQGGVATLNATGPLVENGPVSSGAFQYYQPTVLSGTVNKPFLFIVGN